MGDSGWLPIKTAPDGEAEVLVYCPGDVFVAFRDRGDDGKVYWVEKSDQFTVQPTHWQPLPDPPKEE